MSVVQRLKCTDVHICLPSIIRSMSGILQGCNSTCRRRQGLSQVGIRKPCNDAPSQSMFHMLVAYYKHYERPVGNAC